MGQKRIKKLVIAGGGTAGWITAAAFSRLLGKSLDIHLVESEEIGIVGVGEATIPQIIRLNHMLGLDENEFLRRTYGTFKLGIEFVDWGRLGSRYLHTFGDTGINLANLHFHQYWLRYRQAGGENSLWDYSLHQQAADDNKFARMDRVGSSPMGGLAYAFHFDAALYAAYLREYAEAQGVRRTEGIIASVERTTEDGGIAALKLEDGTRIEGDFFIDCTGFRAFLIGQELKTDYQDWTHWLPCNRAIAVPSEKLSPLPPFTRATAKSAGWQWRIPLQHRTGNGHVFSNEFMSEDEATAILLDGLEGEALSDPRTLKFTTGRRETFWEKNCVAIGLSSGFLEPLESTSIHLIQSNVSRLISLFPRDGLHSADIDEYNRRTAAEFEQVRDFLILHYHQTEREDSPFWQHCRNMEVPEPLNEKMALFRASGRIGRDVDDLFRDTSWMQVMLGQGIEPQDYHPMADNITDAQLDEFLRNVRAIIDNAVTPLPSHEDFIKKFCDAG
ncbi:tryptophan halogenase family protein [Parvularcula marina]|uniref:Tryptophan 7-halogenase n=1 Tax=Parvularcula marina TaxID=2292771 RepID=A0A371RL10_9PROT|nr:tryptophan halogenase family protein [Parvularcula marina]RFB06124.1 tryptophan 7-halogenase [Parvularcula marina]